MNFEYLIYGEMILAGAIFLLLFFVTAPYGRFSRGGWGPEIPARLGWIMMETPAMILPLYFYIIHEGYRNPVLTVFILVWEFHYIQRTVIYPFLLPSGSRPMPLLIPFFAFCFNLLNGVVNGYGIYKHLADRVHFIASWFTDIRFISGVTVFIAGWLINIHSDSVIRKIKKEREGYMIPMKGLHRILSSPNYLGEIMEWGGWALMTWSLCGLAFFFFTIANLVPRARKHLLWYRNQFKDYPKNRKAVIPYLF